MATHNSFSVINCDRYVIFTTATTGNRVSPKYIVRKEEKPLFLCLIHLDSRFSHTAKTKKVYMHQTGFLRNRHRTCLWVSWFGSGVVTLATNGLL